MTSATNVGLYEFVLRGLLTEEALDRSGRQSPNLSGIDDLEIGRMLSLDLLDDELVSNARRMSIVYAAIAAFENSARDLIKNVLLAELGEDWWSLGVTEKVRNRAEAKMKDEENVRWHKRRGNDPMNYTLMLILLL